MKRSTTRRAKSSARRVSSASSRRKPTTAPRVDVPLIGRQGRPACSTAQPRTPRATTARRCTNIVENYPRDELFQISEDELLKTSLAILHLFDRPRAKIFARRDRFDRFVSVMAFVPKERFNSTVREAIGLALARALRRPGVGVLSALRRRAARAHSHLHHRRPDARSLRPRSPSRSMSRSQRSPAPGRTPTRLPCARRRSRAGNRRRVRARLHARLPGTLRSARGADRRGADRAARAVGKPCACAPSRPVTAAATRFCCKIYAKGAPVHLSAGPAGAGEHGSVRRERTDLPGAPRRRGRRSTSTTSRCRSKDGKAIDFAAGRELVRGSVRGDLDRSRGKRRLQRADPEARHFRGGKAALIRAFCALSPADRPRSPRRPCRNRRCAITPRSCARFSASSACGSGPELPEPVKEREVWGQADRGADRQGRCETVVSLDADRVLRRIARARLQHPAHQLLPEGRRRRVQAVHVVQDCEP